MRLSFFYIEYIKDGNGTMTTNQRMTQKKIFLIISLFLLILTSFRMGWMIYHQTPDHPHAEGGIMDLSDWEFNDSQTITLDGEWEFFPNQFISTTLDQSQLMEKAEFISVPGKWNDSFMENEKASPYGYGTYRLKIILPDNEEQLYGIRIKDATTAANVYIDGLLVAESGHPGETATDSKGDIGPFFTLFSPNSNEVELMMHVSNFEDPLKGGIAKSIKIGTENAINKEANESITLQIVVSVIYLLHSIYAFIIYYMGKGKYQKEVFYFGLMLVLHGVTILIDDDIVLHLPINFEWYHNILQILFISTLFSLLIFIKHLFNVTSRFMNILTIFFVILLLSILITPFRAFIILGFGVMLFYIMSISFLYVHTIRTIRSGHPDAIFILLFITSYTSNMIWGGMINLGLVEIPYYPFDFIFSIFFIALLLFKRHIRMAKINEKQTIELKKADKMKDEFLSNTSHELRNPLHGIINIAHTILHDESESLTEKNKENLKLLIRVGQRMRITLNDLLDISRLEDKRIRIKRKPVNLHTVASGVLDMIHFMTENKNLQLKLNVPASFPDIYADQNRLIQILFNLLHNAVKYTKEGSITIDATHKRRIATITVTDTGIGMSDQVLQSIFEPYEQVDNGVQHFEGGIGLGLHISKQLVELHEGKISVESIVDEGTIFRFTIPLADNVSVLAKSDTEVAATKEFERVRLLESPKQRSQTHEAGAKVLVVDDDPVNLKILINILDANYLVTTASDGEEALKLLDQGEWDLVIADVMMPKMSGYELTQKIREQFTISELPILLLTARSQHEDIYSGFIAGANDYVTKPVDAIELEARVQALTKLRQSIKEQLRMEAAWLQAQIHPHFLFNTLNTIASLGVIDTTRMLKLLEEFGNYLRRSFDVHNTESLVPIENELDLTRSYLYIEKERFENRLHIKWEIEDDLDFKVPPLSIQPIVENAVEHGVLKRVNGGTICIRIIRYEKYYRIAVTDDGVGMEQEKIEQILNEHPSKVAGVGVANTNRRLKKLYGKGLVIESKVDEGTTVMFEIPKEQ